MDVETDADLKDKESMNVSTKVRGCALAMVVFVVWSVAAVAQGKLERVAFVSDGDTLVLAGGETVRLAGIDAPELSRDGRPAQVYALEATRFLRKMVGAKEISIEPTGKGRDRHGRLLALLRTDDGRVINEIMLGEGVAFVYAHGDLDTTTEARFLRAQQRAMSAGKGFWPDILGQEHGPGGWIGNSRSKRFHTPDCPDGRRVSDRNRVFLTSLKDAYGRGYAPCRKCTVWPTATSASRLP
jgi:micrococcal nuclease